MAYDHPNNTITREHFAGEAGGAATTEYAKFRQFQKLKLKAVHAAVTTAGTTTGHALDIYHGTTSIGTIALSTSAAGVTATSGKLDRSVASFDQLSVKTKADATGKAHVIFEYQIDPDAVQTR